MLVKRHKTRRAENEIKVKLLKIVLAEAELCAEPRKSIKFFAELLRGPLIAGRHVAAGFKQLFYKRRVAHSDADNAYAFVLYTVYIFI